MTDDKIIRVLRVLEYTGPRDMVYKDLERRAVKSDDADFPNCGGRGSIKEISLEEIHDLESPDFDAEEITPEEAFSPVHKQII